MPVITVPRALAGIAIVAGLAAAYRAGRRRCTDTLGCGDSLPSWGCGR